MALIRHCLEFARLEWGYYLPINPVDLVSKPRLNKPRDRRVGKDDIDTLMHALRQTKVTYLKPLILIAIETGLRQGELVKLKWSDVDLDSRLLGNIFVWELVDFLKPDSLGNLSAGKYIQLDCKLLRFKYLSFAFYKQPMGNGTPEVSKPIKQLQGWKYSPPNTTQEYVKKFICNL